MIVVSHWSKPAWQNMASLLSVVGCRISHSMPQGGKSYHLIVKKPPLVRYCWRSRIPRILTLGSATTNQRVLVIPGTSPAVSCKILLAKSYTPHTYIGVSYDKSACPGHSGHFASSIQKGE